MVLRNHFYWKRKIRSHNITTYNTTTYKLYEQAKDFKT